MAHRLQSVTIGACRRIGRTSLSRCSGRTTQPSSISYPSISILANEQKIITSYHNQQPTKSIGDQYRLYHNTNIVQEGDNAAATAAKTADDEIAPFKSPKVEALFQKIIWLDMVEVHLLAELINEKMGITISDAERERMARGGGGGGGKKSGGDEAPAEAVEEKTIFDLKLTGYDAKAKIKVIKEVRAITSLGLKEAKELVEGAPVSYFVCVYIMLIGRGIRSEREITWCRYRRGNRIGD